MYCCPVLLLFFRPPFLCLFIFFIPLSDRRSPSRPRANSVHAVVSSIPLSAKDISCCTKIWLCCHPCYCGSTFDKDRSYLYIRENSLEGNVATKSCLCGKKDFTFVDYFDRNPYKPSTHCCCIPTEPKLELMQGGCQICCVKVSVVSPGRLSLLLLLRVVRSPFLSLVRLLFGRFCGHYALRKMLLWCSLLQQPCWLL